MSAHALYMDADHDLLEFGYLVENELDRTHEVSGHRRHVHTLLEYHVKVHGYVPVFQGHLNALPKAMDGQQPSNTLLLVRKRHSHDTVALKSSVARKVGYYIV